MLTNQRKELNMEPWIGFDLDGTLAYESEWQGVEFIGEPIMPTIELLKSYIKNGNKCKIFTARAGQEGAESAIHLWLEKQGLPKLEVTNQKDYGLMFFFDDRAIPVENNTGRTYFQRSTSNVQPSSDKLTMDEKICCNEISRNIMLNGFKGDKLKSCLEYLEKHINFHTDRIYQLPTEQL